jgi:hypothetical protein
MKFKFLRAFVLGIICLAVFLVVTFIPSLVSAKLNDFLQGFSGGMGLVAFVAALYYSMEMRKERKASGV